MDYKAILHFLIPLIGYGLITGIANLILSRKSQIELWAEQHPKAAALQKLLRAIGLDPWQIISAISLWATSKLPDAQRSEGLKAADPKPSKDDNGPPSPPLKIDCLDIDDDEPTPRPAIPPGALMVGLIAMLSLTGCAGWKPIVKDIDTAAVILCDIFFSQQPKNVSLSPADIEKAFCSTAEQVAPFLASAKMAVERGGEVRLQRVEQ